MAEYIEREVASRIASIFFTMSMCIDEDECRAMNRAARIIETQIDAIPPANVVEVVRCKDCRWGREACGNIECRADMNVPPEYHGYDWFCPNGE